MKTPLIVCLLFTMGIFPGIYSQPLPVAEKLDTIYANDNMNVALFFPDPIRQGLTGSGSVVFTYNREKQQHLGLLQAAPGSQSNLLVISSSGSVFSYIVKYSEQLSRLNYFFTDSLRIGKEIPAPLKTRDSVERDIEKASLKSNRQKEFYYRNYSRHLVESKQRLGRISTRKEELNLRVLNIIADREEFYFVLEIENASSIDYEIRYLDFAVVTRKKGKRRSFQKLTLQPLSTYNVPTVIGKGRKAKFVYVLPKFSISSDKNVVIDLKENRGERDLQLRLKKRFINSPN